MSSSYTPDKDHPHIHGEHFIKTKVTHQETGSPPYTWGAQLSVDGLEGRCRITPIYMGSTGGFYDIVVTVRDHPHIHGEHLKPGTTFGNDEGITPIYMGSTL